MAQEETRRLVENYMTNKGYIKLHRSILKWEWWQDENTRTVFLYLLLMANWESKTYRGIEIPVGSLITSRNKLCANLKMSERKVRTALDHLQETGEIKIEATNRYSLVSIVNWELYQMSDSEATNKRPTNRPTNDQPNDQPTDQRKALYLVGLNGVADQPTDQPTNTQTTNQPTTYKNIRKEEDKNIYYKAAKKDANKGMITSYTPEFFEELEREVKNGEV